MYMAHLSVAQAARRLGVGVPRIHRRIADGSLRAERVGSQWVVDELSLLRVVERSKPGRPLSARSVWAMIALTQGDEQSLAALAPVERARARTRLGELLSLASERPTSEDDVRRVASVLRARLGKRASRKLWRAPDADLAHLGAHARWESVMSPAVSGIGSLDVDGYLAAEDVEPLVREFLLRPVDHGANVVIHVLPPAQRAYAESTLQLAADLAEQRGPRAELRAAELLHDLAQGQVAR